ncbi:MAG: periplasmic heavy metal sensor [Acidobacteria bacterium]|nr:periplasmic heavy metal sensor [Acidobacteriota bacterium]
MRTLTGKSLFNFIPRLAFAFALLFSFASAVLAQGQPVAPQQEAAPAQAKPAHVGGAASLLMQLNLKPEQIEQMKEIRRQSEPEARALMKRRNQARRALDEALYSDTLDDAAIEQRAHELAEAHAALVRLEAQTQLRVRRVLTIEQLQMFRSLRQQAQRQQRIERRLERGVNPQAIPRDGFNRRMNPRLSTPPDKATDAHTGVPADKAREVRPNAPADKMRVPRPFHFPREHRRRP